MTVAVMDNENNRNEETRTVVRVGKSFASVPSVDSALFAGVAYAPATDVASEYHFLHAVIIL